MKPYWAIIARSPLGRGLLSHYYRSHSNTIGADVFAFAESVAFVVAVVFAVR